MAFSKWTIRKFTKKKQQRLLAIVNGTYKKEPAVGELYDLLRQMPANWIAVILHNLIVNIDTLQKQVTKPTPPQRGRPKN